MYNVQYTLDAICIMIITISKNTSLQVYRFIGLNCFHYRNIIERINLYRIDIQ